MIDRAVVVIVAIPAAAYLVGIAALPTPRGVSAEQAAFDRSGLADVVVQAPPSPRRVANATFGGVVRLRGVDLPEAAVARGGRVRGTLHFEVLGPVDADWQVFVHIDAEDAPSRLNADHQPAAGRYPTSLWRPGEHIIDRFERVVPPTFPPGVYDVWVGLYRGEKRLRARAEGGVVVNEDRVNVGSVVVE